MSLCVIEGLIAHFAARGRVPLLGEFVLNASSTIDLCVVARLHFTDTVAEVLSRQTLHLLFNSSLDISEVDQFTEKMTV